MHDTIYHRSHPHALAGYVQSGNDHFTSSWSVTVQLFNSSPVVESVTVGPTVANYQTYDGSFDEIAIYDYVLPKCAIENHASNVMNLSYYWQGDLSCVSMYQLCIYIYI